MTLIVITPAKPECCLLALHGSRPSVRSRKEQRTSLEGEGSSVRDPKGVGHDHLDGGLGNDEILGRAGKDKLLGGERDDVLNGGTGHDILTGGTGADAFTFGAKFGKDKITDFTQGEDFIDLSTSGITSFEEFSSSITYSDEGEVVVTANGNIALKGFKGQLTADDFLF
jgi:Ca2+-binding RTX toxin-like protein